MPELAAKAEKRANPPKKKLRGLKDQLLDSVQVATTRESFDEFPLGAEAENYSEFKGGDDNPHGGKPRIFLNELKLSHEGAKGGFRDKIILGESLHNLKNVDPVRYRRLEKAALDSPVYRKWAEESYEIAVSKGEKRDIDKWHRVSRFDQVIGGYLFAGDEDIPSGKNWSRTDLPFGEPLKKELAKLAKELGR